MKPIGHAIECKGQSFLFSFDQTQRPVSIKIGKPTAKKCMTTSRAVNWHEPNLGDGIEKGLRSGG